MNVIVTYNDEILNINFSEFEKFVMKDFSKLNWNQSNDEDRAVHLESRDKRSMQSAINKFGLRHVACVITSRSNSYWRDYDCLTHPDKNCEVERFKNKRRW